MSGIQGGGSVYLITGDIGGTNSRMSLYTLDRPHDHQPTITKTYRNETHFPDSVLGEENAFIDYVLNPFLMHCWKPETQAEAKVLLESNLGNVTLIGCIASAGFVSNNQVRLTNLGNLLISGNMIEEDQSSAFMARFMKCLVINDFVAQGYGCLTLKPSEVKHLYGPKDHQVFSPDTTTAQGPKVCVGAGTGLGECYLTQSVHMSSHDPYSCFPSEGGHVEFAPRNTLEVDLFEYLSRKYNSHLRISVERVVSGKGLANVYEFLTQKFPDMIVPSVHEKFLAAGDEQGRIVSENSKEGSICWQAMSILMSAYGCEVGSAAIKWIPTGGLFVSGGLTPKNIHFIEGLESDFMKSYLNKGRVSPLLERIPLYAVMVEDLGVRGAHKAALVAYENYCESKGSGRTSSTSWAAPKLSWLGTALVAAAAAGLGSIITTSIMLRSKARA